VPVNTLVDWVDQALLYLCVPRRPADPQPRDELRIFGIRTATDLIRVWGADKPGVRKYISLVFGRDEECDEECGTAKVEAVLASLGGSPNLRHVEAFRQHDSLPPWPDPADPPR
jgi:hypothetical protein